VEQCLDDSAVCLEERLVVYSEDCLAEKCLTDDSAVCLEERLVVYSGDCLMEQAEESTVERLGVPA
jgi:hypothetical protein